MPRSVLKGELRATELNELSMQLNSIENATGFVDWVSSTWARALSGFNETDKIQRTNKTRKEDEKVKNFNLIKEGGNSNKARISGWALSSQIYPHGHISDSHWSRSCLIRRKGKKEGCEWNCKWKWMRSARVGFISKSYVSHITNLCGAPRNGSRNSATGFKYTSEFLPVDCHVDDPSKFHRGQSAEIQNKTYSAYSKE